MGLLGSRLWCRFVVGCFLPRPPWFLLGASVVTWTFVDDFGLMVGLLSLGLGWWCFFIVVFRNLCCLGCLG